MSFHNIETRKARKERCCGLCCHPISIGEKYSHQSGKSDGEFYNDFIHLDCLNIIEAFCEDNKANEWLQRDVSEWLKDTYCDVCEKHSKCSIGVFNCDKIMNKFKRKESCNETQS